jgi:hypothetical protein
MEGVYHEEKPNLWQGFVDAVVTLQLKWRTFSTLS